MNINLDLFKANMTESELHTAIDALWHYEQAIDNEYEAHNKTREMLDSMAYALVEKPISYPLFYKTTDKSELKFNLLKEQYYKLQKRMNELAKEKMQVKLMREKLEAKSDEMLSESLDAIYFGSPDNRSAKHWQEAESVLEAELFSEPQTLSETEIDSPEFDSLLEKADEIAYSQSEAQGKEALQYTEETAQNFIGGVLEALENGSAKTIDERSEKYYEYEQYAQETEESNNWLYVNEPEYVKYRFQDIMRASPKVMQNIIDLYFIMPMYPSPNKAFSQALLKPDTYIEVYEDREPLSNEYALYSGRVLFSIIGSGTEFQIGAIYRARIETITKQITTVKTLTEAKEFISQMLKELRA